MLDFYTLSVTMNLKPGSAFMRFRCAFYPGRYKMTTVKVLLNSIDKVKAFVNDITKFDTDFDLVSGRYVIDAKSIMGIFSLDLSKPIDLNIHTDGNADDVMSVLSQYTV
jgi:hypothetical protein